METGGASRKPTLTPKAVIHQKYGSKACYKIEEVHEPPPNGCPGLAIAQKGACSFRCNLELPDISVVSGTFKRKRDAEQSAAEIAIEKLGIHTRTNDPTAEESWDELVARINYLFSNEFLSALHPLSGHFRDATLREGDLYCLVPISVIFAYDARMCNLSKWIDPWVESNPYLVIPCILRAAAKLSESLYVPKGQLSIRRKNPYPSEVMTSTVTESSLSSERSLIEVVRIPHLLDKPVESIILDLSPTRYYLDLIAKELGLCDAAKVFISRPVGRVSSETRLYFAASVTFLSDLASDLLDFKEALHFEEPLNARATYLSGQDIYGDAILANIGYTWKSKELFHENIGLQSYYRMLINKTPSGIYKLSREAMLTAQLPSTFTTKANWRGAFPRDVLCTFCRQQRLSEPIISAVSVIASSKSSDKQNLQVVDSAAVEQDHANRGTIVGNEGQRVESEDTFRSEVRIYSKSQELILECSPIDTFKKQFDSIQNVSLRVLLWLDAYFKDLHVSLERLTSYAEALAIRFNPERFFEELASCRSVHSGLNSKVEGEISHKSNGVKLPCNYVGCGDSFPNIRGSDSGISPSNGSLVCISYNVALKVDGVEVTETIENNDEFEFEIGFGCVIPCLEAIVQQMSVGQSAYFSAELPPRDFILASTLDSARILHLLDSKECCLDYSCSLLRVTQPLEDRMEQAFFSPPLSKQRVEFAVKYIKESHASTLVDFGCGSGSLLDSLLNYHTSLQKIVGVDISQKSLSRAAKILHSKLSTEPNSHLPRTAIKSAVLYYGSITDFDPQLCDFDIATCLEVIEHMEEDQAYRFGNLVLSSFCPKLLVVSTPNYEYNVILQGSNLSSQEGGDSDDKTQLQPCKFRNHDHKFEWTREQFNHWARDLATRHNYSVEFSGVGGSGHLEPGYASQIAIFRRKSETRHEYPTNDAAESAHEYQVIWEWNSSSK
ncbi:small RNA 2'-O-methyltransferase-like [Cucurbita moschata]|uniref:Small RNA 2'-O-methyltransferase n=1 Tax=Cucurbita moschata TaxID=3662 RepID=A0A6J1EHQ7_CUCMO|nr:small RNA 2'-O-methyltransferase-like [Cucurbita moschata]XP_022927334.1 small RNA 2'-O-methyltransferase-like [Cucurbita moschata]